MKGSKVGEGQPVKRTYLGIRITLFVFLIVLVAVAGNIFIKAVDEGKFEKELVPDYVTSDSGWQELKSPVITTHWRQDSVFARFTPGNEPLGCWSVAFAQVLASHGLQATGSVSYKTSNGVQVREELVNLNMEKVLTATGSGLEESARYCYQAAVVLQKDFGWGEYMDTAFIPEEISEHYRCRVQRKDTQAGTIIKEISSGYPVIAYFDDILGIKLVTNGHAAVIDGLGNFNNELYVHVNFGWGGKSDGWYNFGRLAAGRELKNIFTVRPVFIN